MCTLRQLAVALMLAVFANPALAQSLSGKVVGVADGDTLTILVGGRDQYKIRLSEIDAPEQGQPFGQSSKRMLSDLAFGKTVDVRVVDVDRYGRSVGRVRLGKVDVNAEMVKRGGAWAYRQYQSDQRFQLWEADARAAKRGLWALQPDQIVAPWDWRAGRRAKAAKQPISQQSSIRGAISAPQTRTSSIFQCGTKWKCGEMASCKEAMFHLNQCGVRRLDGDSDGVPCEKLCG